MLTSCCQLLSTRISSKLEAVKVRQCINSIAARCGMSERAIVSLVQLGRLAGRCTRLEVLPKMNYEWETISGLTRLQSLSFGCFEASRQLPHLQSLTGLTLLRLAFTAPAKADLSGLSQLKVGAHCGSGLCLTILATLRMLSSQFPFLLARQSSGAFLVPTCQADNNIVEINQ